MVQLVLNKLKPNSVAQYEKEERSVFAKRISGSETRLNDLMQVMVTEDLAPNEHVNQLKKELQLFTHDKMFKNCTTMGQIVKTGLDFVIRNYKKTF